MEAQIRAGHPDLEGLCRALVDWSAELRLLQVRRGLATVAPRLAHVRSHGDGLACRPSPWPPVRHLWPYVPLSPPRVVPAAAARPNGLFVPQPSLDSSRSSFWTLRDEDARRLAACEVGRGPARELVAGREIRCEGQRVRDLRVLRCVDHIDEACRVARHCKCVLVGLRLLLPANARDEQAARPHDSRCGARKVRNSGRTSKLPA